MPIMLEIPEQVTYSVVRIDSFSVYDIQSTEGPQIMVQLSRGDMIDGRYVEKECRPVALSKAAVLLKMEEKVAKGTSLYTAIKEALYTCLQIDDKVGSGKIS